MGREEHAQLVPVQLLILSLPVLPLCLLHLPLKVLVHAFVGVLSPFISNQLLDQRPSLEGFFLDLNLERLLSFKFLYFDLTLLGIKLG